MQTRKRAHCARSVLIHKKKKKKNSVSDQGECVYPQVSNMDFEKVENEKKEESSHNLSTQSTLHNNSSLVWECYMPSAFTWPTKQPLQG